MLRQYLGAAQVDEEAIEFLSQLGVAAVLVDDIAGAEAAMADLDGDELIGIDIETAPPDARPEPVRLNADGGLSVHTAQAKWGRARSASGRDTNAAAVWWNRHRLRVPWARRCSTSSTFAWLGQQHLVAHNAAFEIAFLRKHSAPPHGVKVQHPVECTDAGKWGCWVGLLEPVPGNNQPPDSWM